MSGRTISRQSGNSRLPSDIRRALRLKPAPIIAVARPPPRPSRAASASAIVSIELSTSITTRLFLLLLTQFQLSDNLCAKLSICSPNVDGKMLKMGECALQ